MPHRAPMLLLDRIVHSDDSATCCEVTIGPHSLFRQADGSVPAWVSLEYMAQAMAAHVGMDFWRRRAPVPIGLLLGTRRLTLSVEAFSAGRTLRVHAEPGWTDETLSSFACRITDAAGGEVLAEGQLNAYRPVGEAAIAEDAPS